MKVYVLNFGEYKDLEGADVIGVYSTEQKAREAAKEITKDDWWIVEAILDVPYERKEIARSWQ